MTGQSPRKPASRPRLEALPDSITEGARRPSLADRLVLELADHGIDTYFGVPGGAIEPLFNALARQARAGRIRLVTMRSEAGAAFAADGYQRASGRPAVCTATTGPGISNLLTGVMSAHADRVPMLVLTPHVAQAKQGRGGLQDSSLDGYDSAGLLRDCTRYSSCISHPSQLAHKLRRALISLHSQPAGPVHLSFASDILASLVDPAGEDMHLVSLPGPLSDERAVAQLLEGVARARAPLFYVGDDAGAEAEGLFGVARQLGAAVVSSPAGKRWIGHCDCSYAGVLGFSGHERAREAALSSDLTVTFGASFDELSTNAWNALGPAPLFAVDRHCEHLHRLPRVRPVIASTGQIVERLASSAAHTPGSPRPAHPKSGNPHRPSPELRRAGPIHPAALMDWLNQRLPAHVVVYAEAGNSFSWSTRHLQRPLPGTYQVAMGLSSMCWALGAAVGATYARPRRTLCITGDGSMLMSSLELTVAVQHRLPLTYLVLNDNAYGMVRHGQRMSGAESIGWELAPIAFHELARACGATALRVHDLSELERVPPAYLSQDTNGPCLIDVLIDREAVPPMLERVRGLGAGMPQ